MNVKRIRALISFTYGRTGRMPTALYLGHLDYHELGEDPEARECLTPDHATGRFTISGIPLYRVNEERHVGVMIEGSLQ